MFLIYIWIEGYVCFTNSISEQLFHQVRTDIFTTEFFRGTHVLISPPNGYDYDWHARGPFY